MGLREEFEAWLLTDYRNDLYGAFEAGWNRRASPASVPANADLTGAEGVRVEGTVIRGEHDDH